ncbi:MAG: FHA domain-containing protein [bacterium]|nr:FHA domain-containing protein [bacterium]
MDTPDTDSEVFAFQVADADLGPFLIDSLDQPVDAMSPLAPELTDYTPGSARPSTELAEALSESRASVVAEIIACPSFRLWGRNGGGRTPFSAFAVCGRPDTHPNLFVAASPSFEDAWLFEVLDGVDGVAAWLGETYAAPVTDTMPNLLPPPIEIESLLYAFHSIDAFRRVTMQGLLEYKATSEPVIPVDEFISSMRQSIASHDLRWLLPAFMHLVPGLDLGSLDIRDEHLQFLIDQAIFDAVAASQDGQQVLVFGEAGIGLGVEFYDGWLSSIGFELQVRSGGSPESVLRGFLAPTPLTNHFVTIGVDGVAQVNHQAMTLERLMLKLVELLSEAEERAEEPLAAVEASPAEPCEEQIVPALIGVNGTSAGQRIELGSKTTFGRAADNDCVVDDNTASGYHAVLTVDGGSLLVEDLGSTNGTWIGSERVEGSSQLSDGDGLRFGEREFKVAIPAETSDGVVSNRTVVIDTQSESSPPPLQAGCPSCGGSVSPDAKFCRSCGHAL